MYKSPIDSRKTFKVVLLFNNREQFKKKLRITLLSNRWPLYTDSADLNSTEYYIHILVQKLERFSSRTSALFGNVTSFEIFIAGLARSHERALEDQLEKN